MDMKGVYSSTVDKIGYDPISQRLVVEWQRGSKKSVYQGVPPDVAADVMNSPSIGKALRSSVQSVYDHTYMDG